MSDLEFHTAFGSSTDSSLTVINHYYHFAAELLMGTFRMLASFDSHINARGESTTIPTPARAVFPHVEPKVWRDGPRFNQFFLHSVWPSIGTSFSSVLSITLAYDFAL